MNNKERIIVCIPLVCGVVSIILHGIYFLDEYLFRSSLMGVFCVTPIISFAGLLFSWATGKLRNDHKAIWIAGLLTSLIGFLGFLVIEFLTWFYLGLALG